jgi:hypothetical protein
MHEAYNLPLLNFLEVEVTVVMIEDNVIFGGFLKNVSHVHQRLFERALGKCIFFILNTIL